MRKKRLFGTKLCGGYNKKDVDTYITRLEQKIESMEAECRAVKEEARIFAWENERENETLDAYVSAIEEAIEEIKKLQGENETLKSEVPDLRNENEKLKTEILNLRSGNEKLKTEINRLNAKASRTGLEILSGLYEKDMRGTVRK